jgi:DNA adenine methylase
MASPNGRSPKALLWPSNTPPDRASPLLSALRYPGSKRRLLPYIRRVLEHNELRPALLVEPFAGGASVALEALHEGLVRSIGLVDRDPLVASFWRTVFFDTDWLVDRILRLRVSLRQWQRLRTAPARTHRERALACLFLNRTSFSGILATRAGPIGGRKQVSEYTLDCRFPRRTLVRRIRQASSYRDQVRFVWCGTWQSTLARIRRCQARGTLPDDICYYFDPPFFEKADRLYRFYFRERDHRSFRDALPQLSDPWILSYDVAPLLDDLYDGTPWERVIVPLIYSMPSRSAQEAVLSNLELPGARSAGVLGVSGQGIPRRRYRRLPVTIAI